ncbi:MAG: TlpA disulfide reductase family protein [Planctomycetota bacterium]
MFPRFPHPTAVCCGLIAWLALCASPVAQCAADPSRAAVWTGQDGPAQEIPVQDPQDLVRERQAREVQAQREADAMKRFERLKSDRDAALLHYNAVLPGAHTPQRRQRAYDRHYPKPEEWGPRFAEVAQAFPDTEGGLRSQIWIVCHWTGSPTAQRAADELLGRYLQSPLLTEACPFLARPEFANGRARLVQLSKQSPVDAVRATALMQLCELDLEALKTQRNEPLRKEFEQRIAELQTRFATEPIDGRLAREWAQILRQRLDTLILGQKFLDWRANDLQGKPAAIADAAGNYVLIYFWRSQDLESRRQVPRVQAAVHKWKGDPVRFFGISGDLDPDRARRWAHALQLEFPHWHVPAAPDGSHPFGVTHWPHFFVLDPSGVVLSTGSDFGAAYDTIDGALTRLAEERARREKEEQTPPADPDSEETPADDDDAE